ncbi:MAG: HAD hydrolase-like protein [Patescibacteria group bacterium]
MKIEAAIFDFDGCILNTTLPASHEYAGVFAHSAARTVATLACASKFDIPELRSFDPQAAYLAHVNAPVSDQLHTIWQQFVDAGIEPPNSNPDPNDERVQYINELKDQTYIDYLKSDLAPQPYVFEFMRYLVDKRGLKGKLAIGSMARRKELEAFYGRFEVIAKYIPMGRVVCRDDVDRGKPEPDIFESALATIDPSIDSASVHTYEDDTRGVEAAHRAGQVPIMVGTVKSPRDVVRDIAEHGSLRRPAVYAVNWLDMIMLYAK